MLSRKKYLIHYLEGNALTLFYYLLPTDSADEAKKVIELRPGDNGGYYNMSCFYSLQNNVEKACYYLEESIKKGYKDWAWIKKDKDFDNIRNEGCYKQIMKGK